MLFMQYRQEVLGWNRKRVRVEKTRKEWVEWDVIKSALERVNNSSKKI